MILIKTACKMEALYHFI